MANKSDNSIIFDIQVGPTQEVANVLQNLSKQVDNVGKSIKAVNKSLPDMLTGVNKEALSKIAKDMSTIEKSVTSLRGVMTDFGSRTSAANKDVEETLKDVNNELDKFNSGAGTATKLIPESLDKAKKAQDDLTGAAKQTTEEYRKMQKEASKVRPPRPRDSSGRYLPAGGSGSKEPKKSEPSTPDAPSGYSQWTTKFAETNAEKIKNLGLSFDLLTKKTAGLDTSLKSMIPTIQGIIDFASNAKSAYGEIKSSYDKVAGQTKQFRDISASMQRFERNVTRTNAALQATNTPLTKQQAYMGQLAQRAGQLGKAAKVASKLIGPLTAAIDGIQLGVSVVDWLQGTAPDQIKKSLDVINRKMQENVELTDTLSRSNAREAINDEVEAIRLQIQAQQEYINEVNKNSTKLTGISDKIRTILGHAIGDETIYGEAGKEMSEANKEVAELQKRMEYLQSSTVQAKLALAEYRNELDRQASAIEDSIASRTDDLSKDRLSIFKQQRELGHDLINLEKQRGEEMRSVIQSRMEQDRKAQEEHDKQMLDISSRHRENVMSMQATHNKRLVELDKQYQDSTIKSNQQHLKNLETTRESYRKSVADTNKSYQENRAKQREQHEKQIAKIEENYIKDRVKRQKSLAEQLFEAEMANDALRHFMLRREAEKTEQEAAESHKENLAETRSDFQEQQAENAKQHKERLAEMATEHKERIAQMRQEQVERLKEAKAQFEESVAQEKKNHAEQMRDSEVAFQKEKSEAEKHRREQYEENKRSRAEEDRAFAENTQRQRQHLQDSFALELEYFRNREEALMEFISRGTKISDARSAFQNAMRTGSSDVGKEEATLIASALEKELQRMREGGIETEAQIAQFNAVTQTLEEFNRAIETGHVDLTKVINSPAYATIGSDIVNVVMDGVSAGINEQFVALEDSLKIDLTYADDFSRETANLFKDIESGLQDGQVMVLDNHQSTLSQLQEQESIANSQRLENTALANENILAQQTVFNEQEASQVSEHQNSLQEIGSQSRTQQLDDERQFSTDRADAALQSFDTILENESAHQSKVLELTQKHFETIYELEQTNQQALIELNEERFNNELERITEQQATIAKLWDDYISQFSKGLQNRTRDLMKGVERTTASGANSVIQIHSTMMQNIAQITSTGFNAIADQARQLQNSMKVSSSTSTSKSSTKSTGGVKVTSGRGLLAARGAYVDKPTLMVAGEGKYPEIVVPFDKSRGIPNEAMSAFASAFENSYNRIGQPIDYPAVRNPSDAVIQSLANALYKNTTPVGLNIDNIQIGGNITRDEVMANFHLLQQALIDIFNSSINKS